MSTFDGDTGLSGEELGWELVEVFEGLQTEEVNEVLAKNVPLGTLRFFAAYADEVADADAIEGKPRRRLPNLMLLGYLLRVLEERLLPEDDSPAS